MNNKTLGQIAYEKYLEQPLADSVAAGQDLPQFADLNPERQQAWEAAAAAVAEHLAKAP